MFYKSEHVCSHLYFPCDCFRLIYFSFSACVQSAMVLAMVKRQKNINNLPVLNFVAARGHNTEAIRAICCTAHAGSGYSDTSAARSVDALSGCNNQQPTQTAPRWTGLLFLISSPPPAAEQSSLCASGSVLCEMKCGDQLRWKFLRRFKMEFCGPGLPPEFFNFPPRRKTNGCPLWNSLKQFDC